MCFIASSAASDTVKKRMTLRRDAVVVVGRSLCSLLSAATCKDEPISGHGNRRARDMNACKRRYDFSEDRDSLEVTGEYMRNKCTRNALILCCLGCLYSPLGFWQQPWREPQDHPLDMLLE